MFQLLFFSNSLWARVARRVGWAVTFALVLLPAQSAFWPHHVPWVLKVGVGGVAVLAAARPAEALLLIAGLVPFGHVLVTSVWNAYPFALGEALVLAFLAGYLWRQRRGVCEATSPADSLVVPSGLFALVIFASCLVQFAVLQVWHDYPLTYAAGYLSYLATKYLTTLTDPRPWVDGRAFVSIAALLLEGVALLRCASTLCRRQPALARRLTNVIVAAGVGAAILSFYEPLTVILGSNQPVSTVIGSRRWPSPAIVSVDTAGPYFMLVAFVAIGTAAASRAHLLPGLLAGVISIGAMWLTRTRSAIVAGLTTAAAGVAWWAVSRFRWLSPPRAVLASAFATLAVTVWVVAYNPFHILVSGGSRALYQRALFVETGLKMLATEPLVGVGTGQYAVRYPEFASREMLTYDVRADAHNVFLWVGAELGLIGLGLFLWLVVAALARAWSQVRARQRDYQLLGTFAGLAAFIITWLVGQPLSVPQVAYTFWILLGLTAASSTDDARGVGGGRRQPLLTSVALAAAILLVVGSVPIRAYRAISEIDLSHVSYGFYNWETTEARGRFRWTGPRATFFMRSSVRAIEVPPPPVLVAAPHAVQVDIVVDGHAAQRIVLDDGRWRAVRIDAPASTERFWRVDLHVTPTYVPRAVLPNSSDERELGVAVGEISVIAE